MLMYICEITGQFIPLNNNSDKSLTLLGGRIDVSSLYAGSLRTFNWAFLLHLVCAPWFEATGPGIVCRSWPVQSTKSAVASGVF